MLEKDTKTGKVDHPPAGSKDVADGLAGVCWGLTMRREVWGQYGIPLTMIPSSVIQAKDIMEKHNAAPSEQQDLTGLRARVA